MAALKNIGLWSESSKLQIRAEASNLFNHMDSANPDENMGSGTFGYVTSQLEQPAPHDARRQDCLLTASPTNLFNRVADTFFRHPFYIQ